MADERLDVLLRRLEVQARPSDRFAQSLYGQIEPMAIAAGKRDRSRIGRLIAVFRIPTVPVPPATLRQAIALAALLMLLLLIAGLVGSRTPDPNDLVRTSEQAYRDPPAFDMRVEYENGDVRRYVFDGEATLRMEIVVDTLGTRPPGTYTITDVDANRVAELDPVSGTTGIYELSSGLRPAHLLDVRWGADGRSFGRAQGDCSSWEHVEEESLIGRRTYHVRCMDGRKPDEEVWIDAATGLILRSNDVPVDEGRSRMTGEVASLILGDGIDTSPLRFREDDPRWGQSMSGSDDPTLLASRRLVSERFLPPVAVTPPDDDWRFWGAGEQVVGFTRYDDPRRAADGSAGLWILRPESYTDVATGRDVPFPSEPGAVMDWFGEHPYFVVGDVETTQVGSLSASSVPFRHITPPDYERTCPPVPTERGAFVPACRRWFLVDDGYFTYGPSHDAAEATALEVGDTTLLILAWADGPNAEAHMTAAHELLATTEFIE